MATVRLVMTMNERERDGILAGLRMLQAKLPKTNLPPGIESIYTNMGSHEGLEAEEIDALCEDLNCLPEKEVW